MEIGGRYRLVRELGRGGMGRVWEAVDGVLRRPVAVKEVLPPEGLEPEERRRLMARAVREARAAALLEHESIVVVHDVLVDGGRPWIVMELVEGVTLREAAPLPPVEAARVGAAVLGALRAAHAAGVLHRDVTPGNIMLAPDPAGGVGRVVLTDFGIAEMAGDPALTRTGTVIGSPGYIAPERLDGGVVDGRSDLFSLGAALYAAVEGRGPFDRAPDAAALAATLTEAPPRPRRAGPLRPVLAALLRKDPADRPDPGDVERALRRVADGRSRRPRLRGLLLPELAWLTAMAVAAAVFLLPGAVTGPRGAGAYRAGLALCPLKAGRVAFEAAAAEASGVRTCTGGRYSLRWYQGYRGEHGSPAALRFSSVGGAHRWLRFLSGFDLEHEKRYPFTYREAASGSSGIGDERKARRPRPLGGVADEAFIREVHGHRTGADGPVRLMEVVFRDSNVVLSVRTEPFDEPAAAVRAELIATAGAVAAHLRAAER
ncbi:serine/threonine-protein kinase [Actinomadura sp. KC06]|uniref:serine/threonine-protein kinase n=1 Tax=Actinomadura sp. KC06 TaxID=2530369 RepID=UPI001404D010|nr:serine/threonine-protein kinase [Actinomadura sp. KC06]